jgi:hypothetical protein
MSARRPARLPARRSPHPAIWAAAALALLTAACTSTSSLDITASVVAAASPAATRPPSQGPVRRSTRRAFRGLRQVPAAASRREYRLLRGGQQAGRLLSGDTRPRPLRRRHPAHRTAHRQPPGSTRHRLHRPPRSARKPTRILTPTNLRCHPLSFKFAGGCWWRSLAIDGHSGTSRGHGSAMRRPGSRWGGAVERPSAFQAGHIPSWRESCERYALSPTAASSGWLLPLLSPLLPAAGPVPHLRGPYGAVTALCSPQAPDHQLVGG